ncbi:aminotriazole resistance protein [Rutstroemia sp. NJR-2017a BVV2]|nr:aminotriazole resistance protein [Rutstroemia sp. NJR-2017a BVV2]
MSHNVHSRAITFAVTGLAKSPKSTTAATKVNRTEASGIETNAKTVQYIRFAVIQWLTQESRCITFFVDIGNLGMCTIALPTIKQNLGFDDGELQWVMTAYALTYGGFLMAGGRLGDTLRQEPVLKVSMVAFNIFTLICALVRNKIGFLVARALQGMAAAFTVPSAQAMVGHLFPKPKAHALALSWWGATGSMGFVAVQPYWNWAFSTGFDTTCLETLSYREICGNRATLPWDVHWQPSHMQSGRVQTTFLPSNCKVFTSFMTPSPSTKISLTRGVDLGFTALETSIHFLPLGVTAFIVNMAIPHLLAPIGPQVLLLVSWLFTISGVTLLAFVDSTNDYWRLCFPGMILYIMGVGTVYYVSMVIVVTSAPSADQGSVAGVFNMSLNVGGAVFGFAVLTVIANSVANNNGGQNLLHARMRGYQAAYCGAIAWAVLATLISSYMVFRQYKKSKQSDAVAAPEVTTATAGTAGTAETTPEKSDGSNELPKN